MNIADVITKSENFAIDFIAKISDKTAQPARKQAYFMDNQDELKKYMQALQKIVASFEEDEAVTVEDQKLVDRASEVISKLKTAITEYQKELVVDDSVTEEETTAVLTEETISDAMKTNKTTQEISANMNAIAEQQKAVSQIGYNYALVCDERINLIAAHDNAELVDTINSIANAGNYSNIQLYSVTFTPVPLKKQTILTV